MFRSSVPARFGSQPAGLHPAVRAGLAPAAGPTLNCWKEGSELSTTSSAGSPGCISSYLRAREAPEGGGGIVELHAVGAAPWASWAGAGSAQPLPNWWRRACNPASCLATPGAMPSAPGGPAGPPRIVRQRQLRLGPPRVANEHPGQPHGAAAQQASRVGRGAKGLGPAGERDAQHARAPQPAVPARPPACGTGMGGHSTRQRGGMPGHPGATCSWGHPGAPWPRELKGEATAAHDYAAERVAWPDSPVLPTHGQVLPGCEGPGPPQGPGEGGRRQHSHLWGGQARQRDACTGGCQAF